MGTVPKAKLIDFLHEFWYKPSKFAMTISLKLKRIQIAACAALMLVAAAFSFAAGEAESPNPRHLAWGIPSGSTQQLSWVAGAGALSHDVHFGTNATDVSGTAAFQGNQPGTTFDTPIMAPDAVYYWRVDEVTASGTNAGSVWSFRTDNRARYDVSGTVFSNNFINPPNEFRPVKYQLTSGALNNYPGYGFGGYHAFFFDNLYGTAWAAPNPAKIGTLVDSVEAQGRVCWSGDDDGYPSGSAGGLVVSNNPAYEVRGVTMLSTTGTGTIPASINTPGDCEKMVSAVIYPVTGGVPDFTQGQVRPVLDTGVSTTGLSGDWKLCAFVLQIRDHNTQAQTTTNNFGTTGHYPDMLNSNAVASWISFVHEPAVAELHGDPASQLEGFYFNEPSLMQLNWDTSGYACLSWNSNLFTRFQSMHGYDLEPRMAALYEGDDLYAKRVRMHFHQTIAEMLRTSFTKQVADWCGERGLAQSGHPLIEESLNIQVANFGDMLKVFAEVQVPAIDLVMPEPGEMATENYHFPKQMSSMGSWNEYDRRVNGLLDPSIGGHGGRSAPSEDVIHNIVNHSVASGVNTYSTYIDAGDASYGGTGVWSRVNAYAGRLSAMLTGARIETAVALYYPINMFQMEYKPSTGTHWGNWYPARQNAWDNLQTSMISADVNYNIVHPDWLRDATIEGGELKIGSGSYRYLVMPDVEIISSNVLARIQQFEAAGGTVLWADGKPASGAYSGEDAYVAAVAAGITTVSAASVPGLISNPYHDAFDLDINSSGSPRVTRFSRQDRQLYFVVNPSSSSITFQGSWGATPLALKIYNPSTGSITLSPPSSDVTISGYRSVIVEIADGQTPPPNMDVFAVADGSFENPTNIVGNWGMCSSNWNDSGSGQYEVGDDHFTTTADGSWAGLMNNLGTIYQGLSQVAAGDTITVVFYGGRAMVGKNTEVGGVFNCTLRVGGSSNTVSADTTLQANDTWQAYTNTWVATASGTLILEFSNVSGKPWLDKISDVTVMRGQNQDPPEFVNGAIVVDQPTGQMTLSIGTDPGRQYRLVYMDDLLDTNGWQAVIPPLPDGWTNGTGSTIAIMDADSTNVPRRYYRIESKPQE